MDKLTPDDLMSLEQYARQRPEFRKRVLEHKRNRQLALGEHATLYFEDRLTIRYQVQEMLRIERLFEADEIQSELDAYNPLIPDGRNLKATFMIEYPDPQQRRTALAKLIGIEDKVWLQVDGHARIWAVADEDLDRETEEKTSSVHFLRFELDAPMAVDLKAGKDLAAGIDHEHCCIVVEQVPAAVRDALARDLD